MFWRKLGRVPAGVRFESSTRPVPAAVSARQSEVGPGEIAVWSEAGLIGVLGPHHSFAWQGFEKTIQLTTEGNQILFCIDHQTIAIAEEVNGESESFLDAFAKIVTVASGFKEPGRGLFARLFGRS